MTVAQLLVHVKINFQNFQQIFTTAEPRLKLVHHWKLVRLTAISTFHIRFNAESQGKRSHGIRASVPWKACFVVFLKILNQFSLVSCSLRCAFQSVLLHDQTTPERIQSLMALHRSSSSDLGFGQRANFAKSIILQCPKRRTKSSVSCFNLSASVPGLPMKLQQGFNSVQSVLNADCH